MPSTAGATSLPTISPVNLANGSLSDAESFPTAGREIPKQRMEILTSKLALQHRIKEGAENLLNMPLNDSLRSQVESELDMAKNRISSIEKKIDDLSSQHKGKTISEQPSSKRRVHQPEKSGDDFRTALYNASSFISTLTTLTAPASPPSTAASSSVSDTPQDSSSSSRQIIETMSNLTDVLRRNLRVGYELKASEILQAITPILGDKYSHQCRAAAYRLLRHLLVDPDSVKAYVESGTLDWYIVRSLNRDNKHPAEKEQALKLIRTIVEVGTVRHDFPAIAGVVPLSDRVMRAIIAIAEQSEDPFRLICIQTIAEILLIDTNLVSRTGGITFLLHTLAEGPSELSSMLASVFLHIVDYPRKREYLRLGVDLELALADITDAYGKGADHSERMRASAKVIQFMLCTWSGLMYFSMDNMRAIRAVIDTLRIPSLESREIILDMFFDLLNIKSPEWYQTFIDGRRLTMYRKTREGPEPKMDSESNDRVQQPFRLTDQYLALLILIFTHAGLCDALTAMLEESTTGSGLTRKATLLMAEVLQMANRMLPLSMAAEIQAVPRLFCMAMNFSEGEHRIIGTSAMSSIDSLNRNRARLQPCATRTNRPRANSVEDAVRRGQRQVEQVKLKMSMQMEDKIFQSSLLETQVTFTKDYTKWNFDILQELLEGPLLNPKRMEEAIKLSRFVRRLMSFFHPFGHRFSDMPRTKANVKWVRLGCSLLSTLMASPDGIKYLANEDQFLSQIVKSFAQLDPFNGAPDSDPIFSKKRVADTLTYGYLEMLGTLSKYKEGLELLEKFKVFTAFYHLSELRSREDLMKGIIENLNYDIDGHSRIVLSKALTSSYKHIRLYSTQHLGDLIRGSANANAWTLRLLLTQLYDPAPEVCELAVHFLEEVCESKDILQLVVEMQPTMDHLGEIGHPLLLKFMSTPMGFRYLYDAGYIDREMDIWFNERNIYYVVQVEVFLSKVFNHAEEEDEFLAYDGTVPPHFYGEMAKTELGCQILQEKGHFTEFSQFIRKHGDESDDGELIMKLKSILWAVGNVGATDRGLLFLEEEEIIPAVLEIAQSSPIPSIRGTCFFVLGLISSTLQGAEILDDYNWEATLSPLGMPTGVCIPSNFQAFITIPSWCSPFPGDECKDMLKPPTNPLEIEVLTAIQNLANTVIANTASRSLAKMKSRPEYRPIFMSPAMFYRALHTISTRHYRLPVRRYIIDLFNVELNPALASKLTECASALKVPPPARPESTMENHHNTPEGEINSASEIEDVGPVHAPTPGLPVPRALSTASPRQIERIVGFDIQ